MTPDPETGPTAGRAYPYHSGWRVLTCGAVFFGLLGAAGAAMLYAGYQQHLAGRLPVAVALWVIGLFGTPMLFFAFYAVYAAVRDSVAPPLLRVTPGSLLLPAILRQRTCEPVEDDDRRGLDRLDPPPAQPEEVPFSAIRRVRREGAHAPASHRLMIVHDLSPQSLVIEAGMMNPEDFDELEAALRAAVPAAFAPAPPCPHP
jgi:hypothetical protein